MGEPVKVSWVFDVLSPFAYLGIGDLERLPPGVVVEYVPVLLAAILTHCGQKGPAEIPSKRRFTYRFVLWQARQKGLPIRFPRAHPFNPLAALRLVIAAGSDRRAATTVLEAVFRDGRDLSDPAALAEVARGLGIADAERTLGDPAVKQRLRANTDWAIAQGVFGVPTLVIGKELFWGQDALGMALDYLADPRAFEDREMRRAESLPIGVERAHTPK
ncbi:MAG TPA: 2-hydroxychromene-2-carboxylate isomerase [Steroidobacteraceae bacterium]|nr:2-hydroxychromene-2-carboxylate isomerase [Steroidobacteraceae bacterium]